MTTTRSFAWGVTLLLALAGCGGAFGAAMDRGDALAATGSWERAVAEYETASRLDPRDDEARNKLLHAKRRLSVQRVEQARRHLSQSKPVAAIRLAHEAVHLDPASPLARRALDDSIVAAIAEGERDLAAGRARTALEMARLVRGVAPKDPRAVSLEDRARTHLAQAAYTLGEARLVSGKRGAAMLAFADAEKTRPGHRDAASRAAALRAELSSELGFHAVLERNAKPGEHADLALAVHQEVLGTPADPARPLLRIQDRLPPAGALGIRMSIRLAGYRSARDVRSEARSCRYVCGVDHVPNPGLEAARRAEVELGRRAAVADAEVVRARADAERSEREVDRAERNFAAAEAQVAKANDDLTACENRPVRRGTEANCDAAAKRIEQAEWRRNKAAQAVSDARAAWDSAMHRIAATPAVLPVERTCSHDYDVAFHTIRSAVELILRAGVLGSGDPSDLPAVPYSVDRTDATHDSAPGRCAEVARADPLTLPSEPELRIALVERVADGVRGSVCGSYDEYRKGFADEEREHRAAGRADDADEARARWLLTGSSGPLDGL